MTYVLHFETPERSSRDRNVTGARITEAPRHEEEDIMHLFTRDETTRRARARFARSIELLLAELERPEPRLRSMRRLYRRDVAAACAHSLTEIRWVLVDQTAPVRPEDMRALRSFLIDGARSPLYRDDAERARRVSHELAVAFSVPVAVREPEWSSRAATPPRATLSHGRATRA
jgi:hypothetical protein